jgi:glutathione S-transferase
MTETVEFYTNPRSRGAIVHWMLEEVGADYTMHVLDYGTTMKAQDYLALNPMGKVPAIRHRGQVVTEGAAICAYLADAFPEAGLAPPPGERGAYYRWLFFGAGPVEAAVTNAALGVEVPDDRRGMVGYGSMAQVLDTLEFAVRSAPFLAGERFSAADVYTGSQIGWGLAFGTIEERPAFRDYWARIKDRPARQRLRKQEET